jgi:D-arginine dehydrogenase
VTTPDPSGTDADFAIVGGGILGCLAARELTGRRPGARVAVFDRDAVGSGASRRSAGVHFPRGATPRVREMSAYSHDYYEALHAARPRLPIFPVELTLVAGERGAAGVEEVYLDRAKLSRVAAPPPTSLPLRIPQDSAVWTGTGCQYAAVGELATRLARGLAGAVSFREAVAVTAVEPGADRVRLRLSTGERFTASAALLAPGPWLAADAWRDLVAPLGARVKKIGALRIDRRPEPDDRLVVLHDADEFLLPRADLGCWLYSYTCEDWDVDPDRLGAAPGLSPRELEQAMAALRRSLPEAAEHVTGGRLFCDAYAADRQPIVAPLAAAPSGRPLVVFAGAANGSGYRLGPAVAAAAVSTLLRPEPEAGSHP